MHARDCTNMTEYFLHNVILPARTYVHVWPGTGTRLRKYDSETSSTTCPCYCLLKTYSLNVTSPKNHPSLRHVNSVGNMCSTYTCMSVWYITPYISIVEILCYNNMSSILSTLPTITRNSKTSIFCFVEKCMYMYMCTYL